MIIIVEKEHTCKLQFYDNTHIDQRDIYYCTLKSTSGSKLWMYWISVLGNGSWFTLSIYCCPTLMIMLALHWDCKDGQCNMALFTLIPDNKFSISLNPLCQNVLINPCKSPLNNCKSMGRWTISI